METVERLPERIGDNLHGFTAFDRVRRDELRDAARYSRVEALDGALHDGQNLRLRQRREKNLRATRADGRIDLFGFARRCADQDEIGRRTLAKEALDILGNVGSAL